MFCLFAPPPQHIHTGKLLRTGILVLSAAIPLLQGTFLLLPFKGKEVFDL